MKERFRRLSLRHFIPFFVMTAVAVVTVLLYTFTADTHEALTYVAVIGVVFVTLLFPLYTLVFGRTLPLFVCICVCVHITVSANIGTAFKVYDALPWWDLFAHGLFGFNASVIAVCIFRDFGEVKSPVAGLLLALCVAMALGGFWEIIEYICDRITGGDTQRVAESIAAGKSPLADTIEDMMITLVGWCAYAVFFAVDNLCAHKVFRRLGLPAPAVDAQPPTDGEA